MNEVERLRALLKEAADAHCEDPDGNIGVGLTLRIRSELGEPHCEKCGRLTGRADNVTACGECW